MIGENRTPKQIFLCLLLSVSSRVHVSPSPRFFMLPWWFVVYIAVVVSFVSCVSEPDDVIVLPPIDTSDGLYDLKMAEGWIRFKSGNYGDSILKFGEAMDIEPSRSDAYLGLGWGYAMIDQLQSALSNFEIFMVSTPDDPDGHASIAFVYLAQNEHTAAISAADKAISLGGEEYMFHQVPEVRTRNLRSLMAECYYATGQYAEAQAQIDILQPDNKLDKNSSTYKQDLLLRIESLRSTGPVLNELID